MGRDKYQYEPVNFDDDDDDEESLSKALGPSTDHTNKSCSRCLRVFFVLTMLAATVAALGTIIFYANVIFPALHLANANATQEVQTNGTSFQAENNTSEEVISGSSNPDGSDNSEGSSESGESNEGNSDESYEEVSSTTEGDDGTSTPIWEWPEDDEEYEDYSNQAMTPPVETRALDTNDAWYWNGAGQVQNDLDRSVKSPHERKVENEEYVQSQFDKADTSEDDDTVNSADDNTVSTSEGGEEESTTEDNAKEESTEAKETTDQEPAKEENESQNYDDNSTQQYLAYLSHENVLAVLIILISCFLLLSLTICCIIRQMRRRRRQKQQHFSRLVSDLNAAEKFTIVSASDEEESE